MAPLAEASASPPLDESHAVAGGAMHGVRCCTGGRVQHIPHARNAYLKPNRSSTSVSVDISSLAPPCSSPPNPQPTAHKMQRPRQQPPTTGTFDSAVDAGATC